MNCLIDYVKTLSRDGKRTFTSDETLTFMGVSRRAFNMSASRLMKKGEIISPARNFYIIVPPKYQRQGSLPADELIPLLMAYWNIDYYACLLSAAAIHGASHQAIQRFYVMVENQRPTLHCGQVIIEFVVKKGLTSTPTEQRMVKTGYLTVSTPEATAIDLLLYPERSGGPNHIATVLSELIEAIDPQRLQQVAQHTILPPIQRLGYFLENIETADEEKQKQCTNLLKDYIKTKKTRIIPLVRNLPTAICSKNSDWNIMVNFQPESDL